MLYQKSGAAVNDLFGYSVAGAGDVDGDRRADFIVGALYASPGGLYAAGSAYVYSGATGDLLYQLNGSSSGAWFGRSMGNAGDVDGDGKDDFIVGATGSASIQAGSAYVYSGATGTLIYQINGTAGDMLGLSVAGVGDVDGDGKADFIIGAPNAEPGGFSSSGSAYVYSGATGGLLYQFNGIADSMFFGYPAVGVGDVDADGRPDFIVGAIGASPSGLTDAGSVYVYSGVNGSLIYQKDGSAPGDQFGYSVDGVGDLDGDSKSDFMVGAPFADPNEVNLAGSVFVYSGATGGLLFQKNGAAVDDHLGWRVAGSGDIEGDGKPDFMIGAPLAHSGGFRWAGSAFIYSGATGDLLFRKVGSAGDYMGNSVAGTGDVNGDGRSDFIIGAPFADPGGLTNSGSAFVMTCAGLCGDVDNDSSTTIADIIALINNVVFETGVANPTAGDTNCDEVRNIEDIVLLIQYVVFGTPTPCCL